MRGKRSQGEWQWGKEVEERVGGNGHRVTATGADARVSTVVPPLAAWGSGRGQHIP